MPTNPLLSPLIMFPIIFILTVGFVAMFALVAVHQIRMAYRHGQSNKAYLEGDFDQISSGLIAWRAEALRDLSSLVIWGGYTMVRFHHRGEVKSVEDPGGRAWLAFDYRGQGGRGTFVLRTSLRELRLSLERTFDGTRAQVSVDGETLGEIRESRPFVQMSDRNGYAVGEYHRRKRLLVSRVPLYGEVLMRGRRLARITSCLCGRDRWGGVEK